MKNLLFPLIVSLLVATTMPMRAQDDLSQVRKKVAVVLSGGGAKGAAHVGVLRAIEEAGIPIDMVVGTSMGAVVGGLYCAGYTPSQLDTLIRTQDWNLLLSDKTTRDVQTLLERKKAETFITSFSLSKEKNNASGGIYKGQNLAELFSKLTIGYHDSIDFRKLQTPFACVATNIVNGEEVVFTSGKLAVAIRASMAIPGMFTPVRTNGMVLVDGGLVNNFPVDVARKLGADIVIGSSVRGEMMEAENLSSLMNILVQIISIACAPKYDDNIADCDVHLEVDTGDHNMLDFEPEVIGEMIQQGYQAATAKRSDLDHIREELAREAGGEIYLTTHRDTMSAAEPVATVKIRHLVFENENSHEVKTISRLCKLGEEQTVSLAQIDRAVRLLQNDYNYPTAYYSLSDTPDGRYDLTFHVASKNQSKLRLGVRFDTDEMVSAIAQGDVYLDTRLPSSVFLYGRVGKQCTAGLGFRFEPALNRGLSIAYQFDYRDIDMHRYGERAYNILLRKHTVAVRLSDLAVRNFQWELGALMEYFDFNKLLAGEAADESVNLKSDAYINYYAKITYQSMDDGYYPTRGLALDASYTLITDDFAHIEDNSPVSAAQLNLSGAISLTSRFALLPALSARFLFGGDAPTIYKNMIGANYNSKYLPQQIAFTGVNVIEQRRDALIVAGLGLRQCLFTNHYLTLTGNLAFAADHPENLGDPDASFAYGVGIKYGYRTKFGPMEATLGYFNKSDHPDFMINLGYYF